MAKIQFSNCQGKRPKGFYTYAYLRIEDSKTGPAGSPYYIGKGKERRAWRVHRRSSGNWRPPANEQILILKWGLTEDEAFTHEKYLISIFGLKRDGGLLINEDLGGLGSSGAVLSEQHIEVIKRANRERVRTPEERRRISEARKGVDVLSPEAREQQAAKLRGRKRCRVAVERTAAKLRGRKRDPQAVEQGAAKLRGRPKAADHVLAASEAKMRNSAERHNIPFDVWRDAPQVRRSEVAQMLERGWTSEEVTHWLQTGEERIHPLLRQSAEKMGICIHLWVSFSQNNRRTIGKRWRRGLRGDELLAGLG